MKWKLVGVVILTNLLQIVLAGKASAQLSVCGILDNQDGDTNPEMNIIEAFCNLGGTGFFNGTARQVVTPTSDTIIFSGIFTGSYSGPFVINNYNFPAGSGTLSSTVTGIFEKPGFAFSDGGEFFEITATATTFSNNDAVATANLREARLVPVRISNSQTKNGQYGAGPGMLIGNINYDAKSGRFNLPASGLLRAVVPEPSCIISILSLSTIGAGSVLKQKLKHSKSTEKETQKVS